MSGVTHWSKLFKDDGAEARALIAWARSHTGAAGERRADPSLHSALLQEIYDLGFTVLVDDAGRPSLALRTPVVYGEREARAGEFADYLEGIKREDKRTIQGLREGLWDRSDDTPRISIAVRTKARGNAEGAAWAAAIAKEGAAGYLEQRLPTLANPEAVVALPIILRPPSVIPKPGQAGKSTIA